MSRDRSRSPSSSRYRHRDYRHDQQSNGDRGNRTIRNRDSSHSREVRRRSPLGQRQTSYHTDHRNRDTELSRGRGRESPRRSYRPVKDNDHAEIHNTVEEFTTKERPGRKYTSDAEPEPSVNTTMPATDPIAEANEEDQMAAMMGFGGFGTTKGTKVAGNAKGAVASTSKKVEYRQYMNRIGGFNRPLDSS